MKKDQHAPPDESTPVEQAEARTEEANARTRQADLRTGKAMEGLRASEMSYRRLFESARDGILILDAATGRIADVNPFLVKLLGFSRGEMLGKTVGELSPFKDILSNQALLERLQRDEYIRYDDQPLETRDGRRISVEFVSNVYLAGDKKVIQCNIRDISERKRVEATMVASEARYRRLFETAKDGVLILNADTGRIVDVNPFLIELLGYSRETFVGKHLWELGLFKDIAASQANFLELQAKDYIRYDNLALETSDGRRIDVEFVSNAYLVDHFRVMQCNIRDISERKRVEKARRVSEKRFREVAALQELLLSPNPIEQRLNLVTDAVVRIMGADFARIWMIKPGDRCAAGCVHAQVTEGPHVCRFREQCLHLLASSGRYTHTNGDHGRVPFGCYKIGKIAAGEETKFLTNEVTTDPRIHNHAWAKELGLVSFAGYRLVDAGGAPLGVLALFSKQAISAEEDSLLEGIANDIARVLQSARAEALLRDSETRYRALFEGSADGIAIADLETRMFKYANPALCRMLGYTEAELRNLGVMDIHPKESLQHVMAEFEAQALGGKTLSEDLPCLRKDGSVFPADINAVKITIDGRPCNAGFFRDITERKRMEAALRSSEERFRIAAETANDAIYEWDLKQSVEWRGKIDEMLGYEPGEFPRTLDDWAASVHPEDLESTMAAIQAQLEGRAPYAVEYRVRRKDGVYRWWSARGAAARTPDGKPTRLIGSVTDITERKRAEEALHAAFDQQKLIGDILRVSLENVPLEQMLAKALDLVLAMPELALQRKGAIFLVEPGTETLVMKTQRGLAEHLLAACARVQFGKCLCGRAAASGQVEFCDHVDERHTIRYEGMMPHGHYCVPMQSDGRTVGVICLYVEQGHMRDERMEQLLAAVVNALSGVIERKQIETALANERDLWRALLDNSPDKIYFKDLQSRFVKVSKAMAVQFGVESPEALVGKTDFDLFTEAHARPAFEDEQHIIRTGQPMINMDEREVWNDGRVTWVSSTKLPWLDDNGKIIGIMGISRDITERKRAEQLLRDSESRLQFALDEIETGAWDMDIVDHSAYRSLKHDQIFGYETLLPQWNYEMFLEHVVPEDRAAVDQKFRRAVESKGDWHIQCRIIRRDGQQRWIRANGRHRSDASGQLRRMVGIVQDITDFKRAEESLARLAMVVEQASETIVITDINATIIYVNPAFEKSTGYTRAEALGQNPRILKSGKQGAAFYRQMWDVLTRGEIWRGHFTNKRNDGKFSEEDATISPLRDADGKVVNYVAVKRDVTREMQLESQVRQSQKMEAVGTLAGGVAHDFNNMLSVISMEVGLLKSAGGLSPEQTRFADEIAITVDRSAALTRQLLLFSRHEIIQPRDLDLNVSIADMTKMLRRILGETIEVQLKLAEQPLFIHADAGMMDQVLMNLAVNARDAMLNGGHLVIETSGVEFDESAAAQSAPARPGSFVCLSVSDSGHGIPPEILPRIFEPFFTTKAAGKGTGLGLATVFGIVQQHKGWINVHSEVGHGTAFRIYLPRLTGMTDIKVAQKMLATVPTGNETILLVEDEPALCISVRMALSRLGYHILEAPTGVKAMEVWQEHRDEIQLLLTDLVMPDGMTGKDLAQRLLQEKPKLKVIYMSGYSAELVGKDFSVIEGVNFILKPFHAEKLAQTIRDSLDKPG